MPRPGFVLEVDKSTPPILFHHGESLRLEKLPADRTRVVYPAEPLEPLEDPDAAIRHALEHPLGDCEPLSALLRPGMRLTICFDDISLPLPPMRRPDVRQRVIEAVLDQAAAAGVDDIHLIAALASAPAHDRVRAAPRGGRPRLRRLRAARPALQLRRRGHRQPRVPRYDRQGRGGRDQQAGGDIGPRRLRQHHPRRHGRWLEVDSDRAGVVPVAAPSPQRAHPAAEPQLHGSASQRAAPARTGAWAKCCGTPT